MANVVLTPDLQKMPAGTTVAAHLESAFPAERIASGGAPLGAAIESVAVAAAGTLTFATLVAGTRYVGYVGTPARYVRFIGN